MRDVEKMVGSRTISEPHISSFGSPLRTPQSNPLEHQQTLRLQTMIAKKKIFLFLKDVRSSCADTEGTNPCEVHMMVVLTPSLIYLNIQKRNQLFTSPSGKAIQKLDSQH
ncbi:unnamed protein product [Thlaspi arvense]|uniref:Uncharacterized protein n=1 Tax=Thlaspi arvense TaxID=13288 RepID=A0AAU9SUL2_THLAR|nr:unnamed protein product [Thlaspi arvense]